jgi:diguanylate cyclase (GGDEF)-like protein
MATADPVSERSELLDTKVAGDRVELLYSHARGGLIATGAAASMLVLATSNGHPDVLQTRWLLSMYLALLMRVVDMIAQKRAEDDAHRRPRYWMTRFSLGALTTAVIWDAFAFAFLPELSPLGRSMAAITYAAMAGGGVAFFAANRWLGLTYSTLMLVPPSIAAIRLGGSDNTTLGVLGIVFTGAVALLVRGAHRSIMRTLHLARQNEQLLNETEQRRAETESLNAELSQARQQLIEVNHSLEEKVRERTEELEREITGRRNYQRELERLATCDSLTQLANRAHFVRAVERGIIDAARHGNRLAIFFIDLDRFKQVNDGLGHAVGDDVLKVVGQRLQAFTHQGLTVARWGGDEFVILQPRMNNLDSVSSLGNAIVSSLSQPILLDEGSVLIGASAGVSIFPEHGDASATLIENADLAVYQAKKDGRGTTRIYQLEWGKQARDRMALAQDMREAIDKDRLELYFQPIVSVSSRKVVGMEALCRWNHPGWGTIPPASFIPVAEESGLMPLLGKWVLRKACESAQSLAPRPDGVTLAVNVSVLQLLEHDFLTELDATLAHTGFSPQRLKLEITESLFAENTIHILSVLQSVRRRGIRVSIDDFGTGYSSMGYLRRFPIDILKIDGSFVRDIDSGGETIIGAILSMSRSLGLEVIVEGVETKDQLERVVALGADELQGFLIAPPVPAEQAFQDFTGAWNPPMHDRPPIQIQMFR